jgi:hypothetical protein
MRWYSGSYSRLWEQQREIARGGRDIPPRGFTSRAPRQGYFLQPQEDLPASLLLLVEVPLSFEVELPPSFDAADL